MRVHRYVCSWGDEVLAPPYSMALLNVARMAQESDCVPEAGEGKVTAAVHAVRSFVKKHRRELNGMRINQKHVAYGDVVYRPADEDDPAWICEAMRIVLKMARDSQNRLTSRHYDDPLTRTRFLLDWASMDLVFDLVCLNGPTIAALGNDRVLPTEASPEFRAASFPRR